MSIEQNFEGEKPNMARAPKRERPAPELKNPESDEERIRYIKAKVMRLIAGKGAFKEGINPSEKYSMMREGVEEVRAELEKDPRLKSHIQEVEVLLGAVRYIATMPQIIKYKRELKAGNSAITPEIVEEQKKLREDLIEWTDFIKWYVLQNEGNPEYVHTLVSALREAWGNAGFSEDREGLERGIFQELASYKILKTYLKSVRPGSPREDARHAIDFWGETEDGKALVFQTKSSSLFRQAGVFGREDIARLKEEVALRSAGGEDETREVFRDESGNIRETELERITSLEEDMENAKTYAEAKGAKNVEAYLMVVPGSSFKMDQGKFKLSPPKNVIRGLMGIAGGEKKLVM